MSLRLLLSLSLLFTLSACTEPNPKYDPDFVPPCTLGSVQCSDSGDAILVCSADAQENLVYQEDKTCWQGTSCTDGFCGAPTDAACALQSECPVGDVCTALPESRSALATFCIPAPNLLGREAGRACANHDQCQSGYCFRSTCFTPCATIDDCPVDTACVELTVTIDGIQGKLNGCAIEN